MDFQRFDPAQLTELMTFHEPTPFMASSLDMIATELKESASGSEREGHPDVAVRGP